MNILFIYLLALFDQKFLISEKLNFNKKCLAL